MLELLAGLIGLVLPVPPAHHVEAAMQRHEVVRTAQLASLDRDAVFPSAVLLSMKSRPVGDVSLSAFLDDAAASSDSSAQADALREKLALEEEMKAKRGELAISRMEAAAEGKRKAAAAVRDSGVATCEDGVWGPGKTGLLSSAACSRERDGNIEETQRSGFFLVF